MRFHTDLSALILTTALLISAIHEAQFAKILCFFGQGGYSHRVAIQPLMEKLADLGHEVDIFSAIKPNHPHPKVTEILPDFFSNATSILDSDFTKSLINGRLKDKFGSGPLLSANNFFNMVLSDTTVLVRDEKFRNWARSAKYDLIIYDDTGAHIALALAFKINAKIIAFMPPAVSHFFYSDVHNMPIEASWLPDWSQGSPYSFIPDHFFYAYNQVSWYFSYKWNLPKVDELVKELYPEGGVPPLDELMRKIDLLFVNEHYSTGYARALPPSVVPVGGMHVKEAKETLPEDIENFLSTGSNVVFISFGSIIKISELSEDMQKLLIKTVGSYIDTRFLWKWEGEIPKNLPTNILAKKWFPQNDILGHPKCKGFITQGGQMSSLQAVFHGIPMIIIPVWGDQTFNAKSLAYHGIGIHLELSEITKETFSRAIQDILTKPSYIENAKLVSKQFRDRPLSAVDTAAWWVEYVLRRETAHLKSPGVFQYWWQRRLLDFYLTVFIAILIFTGVIFYVGLMTIRFLRALLKKGKQKLA